MTDQSNDVPRSHSEPAAPPRREHTRWPFEAPSLELHLHHWSGASLPVRVAGRNLSGGGAAVYYNASVRTGTSCTLVLPSTGDGHASVAGRIVRCVPTRGNVFELGLLFNRPIRVQDFCATGPRIDRFSFESVEARRLRGTVALCTDAEEIRRAVRAAVRESGVRLAEPGPAELASTLAHADVLMTELANLENPAGPIRTALSGLCSPPPIVALVPGGFDASLPRRGPVPEAMLRLPLGERLLRCAIAEFTLGLSPTIRPASAPGDLEPDLKLGPSPALVQEARAIERALESDDQIGSFALCADLEKAAAERGMASIASKAASAADALSHAHEAREAALEIDALLRACRDIAA